MFGFLRMKKTPKESFDPANFSAADEKAVPPGSWGRLLNKVRTLELLIPTLLPSQKTRREKGIEIYYFNYIFILALKFP